jgi:tRNA dimethylallyltransferase
LAGAEAALPAELLSLPVVLGPTGVGKSRVATAVAAALGGEIVVCDSRQVYVGLDIATNKPSPEELRAVPHHLVGVADPRRAFNAHDFVRLATDAITGIAGRGRLPVLEGGSMLWADALLDGFSLGRVAPRPERRADLERMPAEALARRLHDLDPEARVDERNPVRLVRAIEMLEVAGPPLARLRERRPPPWRVHRVGLRVPLPVLDRRLAERARGYVERGLLQETRAALEAGVPADAPALTGIGYAEAVVCLRGDASVEELPELVARATSRYARRQLRWYRRDGRIEWFDAEADPVPGILAYLKERLS